MALLGMLAKWYFSRCPNAHRDSSMPACTGGSNKATDENMQPLEPDKMDAEAQEAFFHDGANTVLHANSDASVLEGGQTAHCNAGFTRSPGAPHRNIDAPGEQARKPYRFWLVAPRVSGRIHDV